MTRMEKESNPIPLLETRKTEGFLLICLLAMTFLFVKKTFIEDQTEAFMFLEGKPEGSILALRSILQYATVPLVYGWKFLVLAFVVWVGSFSFGYRVTYSRCWQVVTAAELINFVPELIKITWFLTVETEPDFFRISSFYPLSLMGLFDHETLPAQYHYPLISLNLFEVVYWILLAIGLGHYARRSFREMARVIALTYIPIFLLWLGFYMVVY